MKKKENDSFRQAREHFEGIIAWLKSSEILGLSHSEIEEKLKVNGNEVYRRLLQGYFDERSEEEVEGECVDDEGEIHLIKRVGKRKIMSIFGEVEIRRIGYKAEGKKILQPLEAELNLPPEKYSHGVRKLIASEVAKNGYDEGVKAIKRNSGAKVPKRQLEECSHRAALDFEEFYKEKSVTQMELKKEELLIISVDGKGIIMREEDLREATKKKAIKARNKKSKHRLSPGEKRNRKRMATVATVYNIEGRKRTTQSILNSKENQEKPPSPKNKRVWASVKQTPEMVIRDAFCEALLRDPMKQNSWVGLVDGNPTQIRLLKKYAKKHSCKLTIILDLIHVIEYLWSAAHSFHSIGSKEAQDWVSEKLWGILEGKVSNVAAGIRRSATNRKLKGNKREQVDKCANYLLKYKDYLRYDQYLSAGFPIATGVIEGACRYLVKDRMDITGARWSLDGAEAILRLRAIIASGDFESYWSFHLDCEYQRHHQNYYRYVPLMQGCLGSTCSKDQQFSHLF